ncbi:MAG: hypothetical protein ACTTKL_11650, partial [Treponema sp.]
MELFSLQFITFVLFALCAYYAVHRFAPKKQWIVLLTVSMIFYSWSGIKNFVFIFITALSVYTGAFIIQRLSEKFVLLKKDSGIDKASLKKIKTGMQNKKRLVLYAVLILNFGILGYIKYWHTVLEGLNSILHLTGGGGGG